MPIYFELIDKFCNENELGYPWKCLLKLLHSKDYIVTFINKCIFAVEGHRMEAGIIFIPRKFTYSFEIL